mmetsp:Transcript_5490/g.12116  ORF Transcript_5490/g.12116 Transcript_5490/m.12116 type:complete len:135 (+) Transcript_5490:415-819(+)
MAAFSAFLSGREVAKRMVARGHGTMIFTGATAALRGASGHCAFSGAMHAKRALAQSMAREFGPQGLHISHVVVDGAIDTKFVRELFPSKVAEDEQVGSAMLQPDDIARNYVHLWQQPRSAWTFEMDLRPWVEHW